MNYRILRVKKNSGEISFIVLKQVRKSYLVVGKKYINTSWKYDDEFETLKEAKSSIESRIMNQVQSSEIIWESSQ